MIVSNIQIVSIGDYCQLQGIIVMDTPLIKPFLLWYRFPATYERFLNTSGNPFLAALLLPAMVTGEVLEIQAPVSPKLMKAVSTIQDIFYCWNRNLFKVPVRAPLHEPAKKNIPTAKACFFSGGVDSFYTLLKHDKKSSDFGSNTDAINHLILVRGFDVSLKEEDDALFTEVLNSVKDVANTLDKKVLHVETNVREFIEVFAPWGALTHGACLASVGLTIETLFHQIFIGSTYSYADLIPWGSHPILDPLWSTESLSFIHDGCEATRLEKIIFIKDFPIVLEKLRVCFEITGDTYSHQYNCGKCRKCLFTMIGLHIGGTLEHCSVFPNFIDIDLVRNSFIPKVATGLSKDFYSSLGSSPKDAAIKAALEEAFERSGIDLKSELQEQKLETKYSWLCQIHSLREDIATVIPAGETFILVDEDQVKSELNIENKVFSFMEYDGRYWGAPADDESAILQMQHLHKAGAKHIVIAWPAFWWLDHYKKWHQYLRTNFQCVLENDQLIIFSLR